MSDVLLWNRDGVGYALAVLLDIEGAGVRVRRSRRIFRFTVDHGDQCPRCNTHTR